MTEEKLELDLLRSLLHSIKKHPWYEYATTDGPRKAFDGHKPEGDGWEKNPFAGDNGWERFDYHEECYWMRRMKRETV